MSDKRYARVRAIGLGLGLGSGDGQASPIADPVRLPVAGHHVGEVRIVHELDGVAAVGREVMLAQEAAVGGAWRGLGLGLELGLGLGFGLESWR